MAKTRATQVRDKKNVELPPSMESVRQHPSKKTISVAGLFKKSAPNPRSPGISKSGKMTTKAKQHPIYREIISASDVYHKAAESGSVGEIEDVYQELVDRVNGIDVNGRPIKAQGVPTEPQLRALRDEEKRITRPLAEDVLDIQSRRADGKATTAKTTLGETMNNLEEFTERTTAEIRPLLEELGEVDVCIKKLLAEMQNGKVLQAAESDFHRQMAGFGRAYSEALQSTQDDIDNAIREDQDVSKQRKAKWEKFLAEMED